MSDITKGAAGSELRSRAEAKLAARLPTPEMTAGEVDARRLLHELQIYQEELLMQNEELRCAKRNLQEANSIFEELVVDRGNELAVEKFRLLQKSAEYTQSLVHLDESRELLANLAAQVPGVIYQYRLNVDGTSSFPYSSQGMYDMYEVTSAEAQHDAAPVLNRLHPDDHDRVVAAIAESARTLELFHCEFRTVLPGQGERWRWSQAKPQRLADGGTLWHGVILDCTERKLAQRAAEESLATLKDVTNRVPGVVYQFRLRPDGSYCFPFGNNKFQETYGVDPEEAGKDAATVFALIYPDDYDSVLASIGESAAAMVPWNQEFRITAADGSLRWLLANSVPRREADGSILWNGFTTDITERKKSEQLLQETTAAAETATIAKSQFLANMSHEIRTPMNGILGMTQLLELTGLSEQQREYVTTLKLSGNNLLALINDILDLARIEAGKVTLESVEFSLRQCLEDLAAMQQPAISGKNLVLSIDLAAGFPLTLRGDQLRLKQILLNLLGNAVKFTPAGRIAVTAEVLERCAASLLVRITVCDSGIGIAAEALEDIFRPFTQEDGSTTRRYGGTGLGLTISRRLAEIMGGTISVESRPGVGSSFMVTLPFRLGQEVSPSFETAATVAALWSGPPLRVLFVEDEPLNSNFGRSLFRKLGFAITVVENGRECLTALEQGSFDMVLMDIQMPIMSGDDALREIRRREQGTQRHQPVIAVTAYSMRGDREKLLAGGFDGYISKPIAINELLSEIQRLTPRPPA